MVHFTVMRDHLVYFQIPKRSVQIIDKQHEVDNEENRHSVMADYVTVKRESIKTARKIFCK